MDEAVIDIASLGADTQDTSGTDQAQEVDSGVEQVSDGTQEQTAETVTEAASGKSIRDAVRQLSAASPEHAKLLKQLADTHFRVATGYQSNFKTPQEAASAKQLIDAAGGVDGITQITQRIQQYDQQDAAFREGRPEVIDSFFTDFPEGAAALAPHYLDKLSKANPDAYNAAVGPHAIAMLEANNVGQYLRAIASETDPERAKGYAKELAAWFEGQKNNAELAKTSRTAANPAADKIKTREQELNQREEDIFRTAVNTKVKAAVAEPVKSIVDQYARSNKWNEKQTEHFKNALQEAVIAEMNGDQSYKQQIDLRYANKSRTHDTVAQYAASEFTRRMKEKALTVAQEENALFGRSSTAGSKPGTGVVKATEAKAAPGGGPLRVSAQPADDQIDWNRPNADINFIKGMGYLKTGHFVRWR